MSPPQLSLARFSLCSATCLWWTCPTLSCTIRFWGWGRHWEKPSHSCARHSQIWSMACSFCGGSCCGWGVWWRWGVRHLPPGYISERLVWWSRWRPAEIGLAWKNLVLAWHRLALAENRRFCSLFCCLSLLFIETSAWISHWRFLDAHFVYKLIPYLPDTWHLLCLWQVFFLY